MAQVQLQRCTESVKPFRRGSAAMTPFGGDLLKENIVLQLGDFPPAPPVPPCLCHSWHAATSPKARDDLKVLLLA